MARPKKSGQTPLQVDPVARETIVKPITRVNGETHPLEDLDLKGDLPELKSIGIKKLSGIDEGKRNDWVSFVMTTRGNEITSLEVSEPDHKAIAEDNCKTNFVALFMNQDGLL